MYTICILYQILPVMDNFVWQLAMKKGARALSTKHSRAAATVSKK